jgi:capsule polysaccharide export protein KpsE/RkpR
MQIQVLDLTASQDEAGQISLQANWVDNATLLWEHRHTLARVALIALVASLAIAFIIPKTYKSSARIMPPDQSNSSSAMLAALISHSGGAGSSLGGLSGIASSLLGAKNTSALFVDLLHSGTITGQLIDRFNLQHIYHKRYRVDTAKYLVRHTTVDDDKKSGVISITVEDTDPRRARDLTKAYLEELNQLVNRTNTSSAHQERVFIEKRLKSVQDDLEQAQMELSQFSSTHTTLDIKEQTHAMVDAAAKLQGQLIVSQSEVDSLQQIYGDANVRVRAAQARVNDLKRELSKMSGSSAALPIDKDQNSDSSTNNSSSTDLYPSLRQLPRLAVPYANLFRRVRVQETVFELLTQEYELARVQEAKDVPVISVIDEPGIPEKKSFPPRLLVALLLTLFSLGVTSVYIIIRHRWRQISVVDQRKILAEQVVESLRAQIKQYIPRSKESA